MLLLTESGTSISLRTPFLSLSSPCCTLISHYASQDQIHTYLSFQYQSGQSVVTSKVKNVDPGETQWFSCRLSSGEDAQVCIKILF